MSFVRDQWYVAAYGAEVGRALLGRTILGEPLVLYRTSAGQAVRARRPLRAPPLPAVREPARRRHDRLRLPRLHLRPGRPLRRRCPGRSASRAPPGSPPTRSSSRTPSSGSGSATRTAADPAAIPRAPWLADPDYDDRPRHGAAGRPLRAAGRQPARPLARDLPARRLHRHPRGRRDPDHHRGRRGARASSASAGTWTTPSARRSTRGPPASRAASPAGRTSSTTRRACTCCTAGSRPVGVLPRPDGTDPRRASTSRSSTRSPRRPSTTTYDFWAVARDFAPDDEEVTDVPARQQPHRGAAGRRRAEHAGAGDRRRAATGYQELSINIDTGGLAARRILARLVGRGQSGAPR